MPIYVVVLAGLVTLLSPAPAACVTVDAVVVAPQPKQLTINGGVSQIRRRLAVLVRNADSVGQNIQLDVDASDCPAGLAGSPAFANGRTSTLIAAQTGAVAFVPLTVSSASFTSFNFKAPTRCSLLLTATTLVVGSTDATPENNRASVEISVIDKNDRQLSDKHETTIRSGAPVNMLIRSDSSTASRTIRTIVGNADYLPAVENPGDAIRMEIHGTCPGVTFDTPACDLESGSATVRIKGGATKSCRLTATANATQIDTPNLLSPQRCVVTLTAVGPSNPERPMLDASNNSTEVTIDVVDQHDFLVQ